MVYARQGRYGVAASIIKLGFDDEDLEGSTLGARREQLISDFANAPLRKQIEAERKLAAKNAKEAREKAEKELRERKETFVTNKKDTPPEPLLGPYDLINWPIRSANQPWELVDENGKGLLIAKPKAGGGNWWLGPNGRFWEDYSLTFQVKVAKGKMVFFPRTRPSRPALTGMPGAATYSGLPEAIAFEGATHGTDWITVEVDVSGGGDATEVKVTVKGGDSPGTLELKGADLKADNAQGGYYSMGSFLFVMREGSEVHLRDVAVQVVRHRRRGILD
jgi:hypothetical protein